MTLNFIFTVSYMIAMHWIWLAEFLDLKIHINIYNSVTYVHSNYKFNRITDILALVRTF